MKNRGLFRKIAVLSMAVVFALALAGCSGSNMGYTGGVAATVNGKDIEEDTVTKYIQDFRTSADLTTDEAWGEWMKENDYTPESVREFVIDYYVDQALVEQAASEREISVSDEDVQSQVDSMKANYDSDEAWNEALEGAGITEDAYRDSIKQGLLAQRLQENVASDAQASDEEVLEMYNMYSSMFKDSKRSSHILFNTDDESTAQEVLGKIRQGEISFADAAKQYSQDTGSAEKGGDVGWNTLNNFVTEYTDAVNGLNKGDVSDLVKSDYGYHIITVTDTFTPAENTTDLGTVPTEFVDYIREIVVSQNKSNKYTEWFEGFKEEAEVNINPMPENVPYNIDSSYYEPSDENADGNGENGEGTEGTDGGTATEGDTSAEGDASAQGDSAEGEDSDVITLTEEDLYGEEGAEGDGAAEGDASAEGNNGNTDGSGSNEPAPAEEGE